VIHGVIKNKTMIAPEVKEKQLICFFDSIEEITDIILILNEALMKYTPANIKFCICDTKFDFMKPKVERKITIVENPANSSGDFSNQRSHNITLLI
jgi:hypothetical protein